MYHGPVLCRATRARFDFELLETGLNLHRLETRRFPTTAEGLAALGRPTERSPEGFLEVVPLVDPWGRPYLYESDGSRYLVRSLGADGAPGGVGPDADITSDEEMP